MFIIETIESVTRLDEFIADMTWVHQCMVCARLGTEYKRDEVASKRLSYFVECVLASAPNWDVARRSDVCRLAAEAAELLATIETMDAMRGKTLRIRAALLYELASLPAMSYGTLHESDVSGALGDLINRHGAFSDLSESLDILAYYTRPTNTIAQIINLIDADIVNLAQYEHGEGSRSEPTTTLAAARLARYVSLGMTASEFGAFAALLRARQERAVRGHINAELFATLRDLPFPLELFPAQIVAIQGGLLNHHFDAWGFAAPTGTGKTFLARLLIFEYLQSHVGGTVLYIVPSRALVYEITNSLNLFFKKTSIRTTSVSSSLAELSPDEEQSLAEHDVLVLTPEKADLLLRISEEFLSKVRLVVVDEAHHIESGTRGALLEFYLWRLRRIADPSTRVVLLSAVAPNIHELTAWIGITPTSITSSARSTRMRAGIYRTKRPGHRIEGWIDYADGSSVQLFDKGVAKGKRRQLVQLADRLHRAGPVLIVAKGKKECENIAAEILDWKKSQESVTILSQADLVSVAVARLDSRLEREMYSDVPMRDLLKYRIVYHHAGLPPRVRTAVEDAIRGGYVDFVCATTTLAEGVNFPFSSVVVQSLAIRGIPEKGRPPQYHPVTPRSFWNIAGRAGRPGVDNEGQVILFEPSLGIEHTDYVISAYMDASLSGLEPVRSALGSALKKIKEVTDDGTIAMSSLTSEVLSSAVPKKIQGAINLVRIALIHASASKVSDSPEEIAEGTLALRQMEPAEREFARNLFHAQSDVVESFFSRPGAPDRVTVAELGLSISTLSNLREYAQSLSDRQVSGFANLIHGGQVNEASVVYVLGPVCKRMAELEGPELGGFYGDVAAHWIAGIPMAHIDKKARFRDWSRLEDLINVMYSRIQYLLPWGLYAFDKLVEEVARSRSIQYDNHIRLVSYLADAGVPSIDALRLVGVDIERVDATRLALVFKKLGGKNIGVDIIGWLASEQRSVLERAVRGIDNRKIDYDFSAAIAAARAPRQRI